MLETQDAGDEKVRSTVQTVEMEEARGRGREGKSKLFAFLTECSLILFLSTFLHFFLLFLLLCLSVCDCYFPHVEPDEKKEVEEETRGDAGCFVSGVRRVFGRYFSFFSFFPCLFPFPSSSSALRRGPSS